MEFRIDDYVSTMVNSLMGNIEVKGFIKHIEIRNMHESIITLDNGHKYSSRKLTLIGDRNVILKHKLIDYLYTKIDKIKDHTESFASRKQDEFTDDKTLSEYIKNNPFMILIGAEKAALQNTIIFIENFEQDNTYRLHNEQVYGIFCIDGFWLINIDNVLYNVDFDYFALGIDSDGDCVKVKLNDGIYQCEKHLGMIPSNIIVDIQVGGIHK